MDQRAPVAASEQAGRIERQRHFIRAMSKSIEGQALDSSERTLLEEIFAALMRGEDVSNLTGIKRPHTRRSSDPIHIALHYLCLTRLKGTRPDVAWDTVGEAWGLDRRYVQRLVVQNRERALAVLPRFADDPDRLFRICERNARASNPSRDRSAIRTPVSGPGNTLIGMLTRLPQSAVVTRDPAA